MVGFGAWTAHGRAKAVPDAIGPILLALAVAAAVTLGLVLLAMGSGAPGGVIITPAFVAALAGWLLVVSLVATRGRHLSGATLGAVSGVGYAGGAVAVRGVDASFDPLVVAAFLAVPLLSVVAFWLYSLALSRTGVAAATGALIVLQTFVPAAIGIAFLGDGVRDGWWPAIAAGLVLGVGGAVALSVPVAADDRMTA